MDRKLFYDKIRTSLFKGVLTPSQVQGIDSILDECEKFELKDVRQIAYILATVYHECAQTMQPIEEYGKGKNRTYGHKVKRSGKEYADPNHIYYGRGFVQLTWFENYEVMGKKLGLDLLNKPELCLRLDVASKICLLGMTKGLFTGVGLSRYFNDTATDYIGARKIINGKDCAELIAGYAVKFHDALV